MPRILALFALLFVLVNPIQAQLDQNYEPFLDRRDELNTKGMRVLKTWGAANLAVGIGASIFTEGTPQAFHQMNAMWGGVNLLIGILASKSYKNQPEAFDYTSLMMEQKKTERVFLINSFLDVLYVGGGAYVLNYSDREGVNKERLEGFAYSIMLQGAFLLVFDSAMYYLHKRNRKKKLEPLMKARELYGD